MSDSIPVISPVGGTRAMIQSRYSRLYNNPHFDYLSEMLPRDIKELFRWCELVHQTMPVIANGVRKLINYPVTDFSCVSDSEKIKEQTREILDRMKLKSLLLEFGTDYYVYGNVFRTLYFPIKRLLRCTRCQNEVAVENADFKVQKKKILLSCPTCGEKAAAEFHDIETRDASEIRVVRWDPKKIELQHNPITGSADYYYELPKEFVEAVRRGDRRVLLDTPEVFVRAALEGRNIRMGSNFYHAKTSGLAGFASGWGLPPLMATLKNYMYIAVLRRAAESIGMEHITPQRILFPQSSGTSDPCVMASMTRWKDEITSALERWRMDPNYVMTAPFPTGIANIGSQGRNLIPTEEIKDARMEMAMALDIPPGMLMGDANIQNSAVSLRILENQLTPYVEQLHDFANWVIRHINAKTKRNYCEVRLVPFKLADDLMNKQMLLQSLGQLVSRATLQEALNLDPVQERERLVADQISDHETQREVEKRIREKEENIASQAQMAEQEQMTGQPAQYNQQKMIAQAQEQAMQLLQVPYEERRSVLAQLQNEDYVMWALVSKQLEALRDQSQDGAQQ